MDLKWIFTLVFILFWDSLFFVTLLQTDPNKTKQNKKYLYQEHSHGILYDQLMIEVIKYSKTGT